MQIPNALAHASEQSGRPGRAARSRRRNRRTTYIGCNLHNCCMFTQLSNFHHHPIALLAASEKIMQNA